MDPTRSARYNMSSLKGVNIVAGDLKRAEDTANIIDAHLSNGKLEEYMLSVDLTEMPKGKNSNPTETSF